MAYLPRLAGQGRHAARHAAKNAARHGVMPGHIAVVRHVASCALFACTCLVSGTLRAGEDEAQRDADTHCASRSE